MYTQCFIFVWLFFPRLAHFNIHFFSIIVFRRKIASVVDRFSFSHFIFFSTFFTCFFVSNFFGLVRRGFWFVHFCCWFEHKPMNKDTIASQNDDWLISKYRIANPLHWNIYLDVMMWLEASRVEIVIGIGIQCEYWIKCWKSSCSSHFNYSLLFANDTVMRYFSRIFALLMTLDTCVCVCVCVRASMDERRRFKHDTFLVPYCFFPLSLFIAICNICI